MRESLYRQAKREMARWRKTLKPGQRASLHWKSQSHRQNRLCLDPVTWAQEPTHESNAPV
jgi:hypothetical protein